MFQLDNHTDITVDIHNRSAYSACILLFASPAAHVLSSKPTHMHSGLQPSYQASIVFRVGALLSVSLNSSQSNYLSDDSLLPHRCTQRWIAMKQQTSTSQLPSMGESTLWLLGSGHFCLSFWREWLSCMRLWCSRRLRRCMQNSCSTSWTPNGMPNFL